MHELIFFCLAADGAGADWEVRGGNSTAIYEGILRGLGRRRPGIKI
jgi:hypothetical protein